MDGSRKPTSYALTGLMCIGALACAPERPNASDGSETTGDSTQTSTDSGDGDGDSGDGDGDGDSGDGDGDGDTGDGDGDPAPECDYPATICGELSVCECSCDNSADCCYCTPADCTDDSHCTDDDVCVIFSIWQGPVVAACAPAVCETAGSISLSGPDADPSEHAQTTCARTVNIQSTTLTDLAAFANLTFVLHEVTLHNNDQLATLDGMSLTQARRIDIQGNDALTSIDALASLESIEGGSIFCNAQLDTAAIDAVLAQIPGGDLVEVGLNGEGPC